MDRNRKILISILAMLVFSAVIAIIDIGMKIPEKDKKSGGVRSLQFGPGIALVRIEGSIDFARSSSTFGFPSGAEAIIKKLDDIEKDSNIKGVIIRINSPGGTVAATQEIYQKIWKLRKKNIPIVASMGEIAASGGYYTASACNYIFANHGTITGSIGVIAMSPNIKRLMEKLGISLNVIKSGKYKDIFSSTRDITDAESALLQEMIDSSYRKFLKDISLGRNMSITDIEPYADGRIMSGETALKHKFVDALGTYEEALDKAKELAKLPSDAPVYEGIKSPFQQFMMSMDGMFKGLNTLNDFINRTESTNLEYRQ